MVTTRLLLTGIQAQGRHGANPGEKDAPQMFVVDLDLEVEVGDDELAATADYRGLIATAREVVGDRSFDLLESLAQAVAAAVLERPAVRRVRARVHKPGAARSNDVGDVAAEVALER